MIVNHHGNAWWNRWNDLSGIQTGLSVTEKDGPVFGIYYWDYEQFHDLINWELENS